MLRLNKAHYFMGLPQKCTSTDKYFIDAIGETHNYAVGTGYGAVNTVSLSVSVTKLVLTPTLTLNDQLSQNFTTK